MSFHQSEIYVSMRLTIERFPLTYKIQCRNLASVCNTLLTIKFLPPWPQGLILRVLHYFYIGPSL